MEYYFVCTLLTLKQVEPQCSNIPRIAVLKDNIIAKLESWEGVGLPRPPEYMNH